MAKVSMLTCSSAGVPFCVRIFRAFRGLNSPRNDRVRPRESCSVKRVSKRPLFFYSWQLRCVLAKQIRSRRTLESFPLEGEPGGRQQHHNSADDPDGLRVGRLHAEHDQEQAADRSDHGQRAVPNSDLPWAHSGPASAISNQSSDGRKHIGDIEKNDADSSDGRVRNNQDECERDQRRRPNGHGGSSRCRADSSHDL